VRERVLKMNIRKLVTIIEETAIEGQRELVKPTRKAAAVAVIKNPFAGKYQEDLSLLVDYGEELGGVLAEKAVRALGVSYAEVESYGKAAIVGEDGEIEHAAALLHPKLGRVVRALVKEGKAMMPSAKKRGGIGTSIDIPLHYKKAAFVRSHYDAMEIRIPDAPNRDEIVLAVAFADSGRPLARVGGLRKEEVKGEDGLY
jgi:hypothetical protein